MKLKSLFAVALFMLSGAVSASPVGPGFVGNIDNSGVLIGDTIAPGASFTDLYYFTVSATATGASVVYSIPSPNSNAFTSFNFLGFFDSAFNPLAYYTAPPTAIDGTVLFAPLPSAGTYILAVAGTAGSAGGSYNGFLVAQLPEPETLALLLVGLIGIPLLARRKRH